MSKSKVFQFMVLAGLLYALALLIVARANAEPLQATTQPVKAAERVIVAKPLLTPVKPTETPTTVVAPTETPTNTQLAPTAAPTETPIIAQPVETAEQPAETPEPTYIMYFTEQDAIAVAQMLWGEARGCTLEDKQNCVRTVCNRVDDARYPDTPYAVVTQRCQYYGYSSSNPVDSELYDIAVEIMTAWSLRKQGVECEWYSYNCFSGDGVRNYFYTN